MIRDTNVLKNETKKEKMRCLRNEGWWKIILYCLSFLLIFFISATVAGLLTGWISNPSVRFAVREIFLRLPLTFVLFWLFAHYIIKKSLSFFMIKRPTKKIMKWIGIGFVLPLSVILIYLIFGKAELIDHAEPLSSFRITYYVVASISMALLGGIIEEILFRGFMFRILEEKWNPAIAIIVPGILFASVHLLMINSFGLVNITLVIIPITIIAVMVGLIVYVTRNIWNAVVVHGIWNLFLAGIIIKISAFENDPFHAIFPLKLTSDNVLLTGGSFGVESAAPAIAVYLTTIIVLLLYTVKKLPGLNYLSRLQKHEFLRKRNAIVLLLSWIMLFSHTSGFAQEADPGISEETVMKQYNQTTLYPQSRLFGGLVFCQDDGNRVYLYKSRELHDMLLQTPTGKRYIEESSKNRRIAAPLSILSSAILLTDVVWFVRDPNSAKEQPILFWGNFIAGIAVSVVAGHFNIQSGNSFLLAVREYNKNAAEAF